jgi:tetratricopeptide (TPR) repeat protein
MRALAAQGMEQQTDRGAADLHAQCAELARELSEPALLASSLNNAADCAMIAGDLQEARRGFEATLAVGREAGLENWIVRATGNLSTVEFLMGESARALERSRAALSLAHEIGFREDLAYSYAQLAAIAAVQERAEDAATLLGAADRVLCELGTSLEPVEARMAEETACRVRETLGEDRFAGLRREGAAMADEEAVVFAVAAATAPVGTAAPR